MYVLPRMAVGWPVPPSKDGRPPLAAPPHEDIPFERALDTRWQYDAHAVSYRVRGYDGPMPRLNLDGLHTLREQGKQIELDSIFVDIDNPSHLPWSKEIQERTAGALANAVDLLSQAWMVYTTRNGLRVVYKLHEPLVPESWVGYQLAVLYGLSKRGLLVDMNTAGQWNRLYRLPRVVRDRDGNGEKQWEQWWYHEWQYRCTLDAVAVLQPIYSIRPNLSRGPKLFNSFISRPEQPVPLNELRRRPLYSHLVQVFSGEPWGPAVFFKANESEDKIPPLAPEGSRHNTLIKIVGSMAGYCARLAQGIQNPQEVSPELLWSILVPACERLGHDRAENFVDTAWKAIVDFWNVPESAHDYENTGIAASNAVSVDAPTLLSRVKKWWPSCTEELLACHAVLRFNSTVYLMGPDGRYLTTPYPIQNEGLTNAILRHGLQSLIPLQRFTQRGGLVSERSQADILRNQVRQITAVVHSPLFEGDLDIEQGVLRLPCHSLIDLEPRYDNQISDFLFELCGRDESTWKWLNFVLGAMPQVKLGNMQALHMFGLPGAGKGLIARGLSQCFRGTSEPTTGAEFFQRFNANLLSTPVIHIDERFPGGGSEASARFRSALTGDAIAVEQKYGAVVQMRSPFRIIITSNSPHVLRTLFARDQLMQDDIEALRHRLLILQVSPLAQTWLARHGNYQTTAAWTRTESRLLARHFLALSQQHLHLYQRSSGRFLVPPQLSREDAARHLISVGSMRVVLLQQLLEAAMSSQPGVCVPAPEATAKEAAGLGAGPYLQINYRHLVTAVREDAKASDVPGPKNTAALIQAINALGFAAVVSRGRTQVVLVSEPALKVALRSVGLSE